MVQGDTGHPQDGGEGGAAEGGEVKRCGFTSQKRERGFAPNLRCPLAPELPFGSVFRETPVSRPVQEPNRETPVSRTAFPNGSSGARRKLADWSTKMSDHSDSSHDSQSLCDQLHDALAQRIEGLARTMVQRWCCYHKPGRQRRFAYVTHRLRTGRLEVWFLGGTDCAPSYPSLEVRARKPTRGSFGKNYPARFLVETTAQVQDAADLLFHVSYPLS